MSLNSTKVNLDWLGTLIPAQGMQRQEGQRFKVILSCMFRSLVYFFYHCWCNSGEDRPQVVAALGGDRIFTRLRYGASLGVQG